MGHDAGPMGGGPAPSGSGWGRVGGSPPVTLLLYVWLVYSVQIKQQTSPFGRFPGNTYDTFPRLLGFDVSYLSLAVISGGISATSGIYEYFGRQLKGISRALHRAHLNICL